MVGQLFLASAVLMGLSMLLSIAWHRIDKYTEQVWNEHRRLAELQAKNLRHPSEVQEHAEEVDQLQHSIAARESVMKKTYWVRPLGLVFTYGSLVTLVLALLMGGIQVLR